MTRSAPAASIARRHLLLGAATTILLAGCARRPIR